MNEKIKDVTVSVFISVKPSQTLLATGFHIKESQDKGINRRETTPQSLVMSSTEAEILESPSPSSPEHYTACNKLSLNI
jgi:hypothetical protein